MQKTSAWNKKFLQGYGDVLHHHVECILQSGMILDEDVNLLMTFWDPTLAPSTLSAQSHFLLTSASFTTAGLLTAIKLKSVYPIALSLLPVAIHLTRKVFHRYKETTFKRNFEQLLKLLNEIYLLNKEVSLYYSKRDFAVENDKLRIEAFTLLLKPGEEFLKFAVHKLQTIIEEIKRSMSSLCEYVPISEGQFICSLEWSLDTYRVLNNDNYLEMKTQFEKLTDLYLLITSNFLGCIGLCMCTQLWKEPCDFQNVFTQLIPRLKTFLKNSLEDMQDKFRAIRYNLCDRTLESYKSEEGSTIELSSQISKPLLELLLHVQVTFDKGKHLQLLLESKQNNQNYEEFVDILREMSKEIEISRDCLWILMRRIDVATSKNSSKDDTACKISIPPLPSLETIDNVTYAESIEELKDEEYNLSIHGSDNDCPNFIDDIEDMSSSEDLNVLLLELKRKLLEKRPDKAQEQMQEVRKKSPPPPKISVVNHSMDVNSLLKSVMLTAQNLKRSEEFQFGFNMFPEIPRPFNTTYQCFSVALLPGNERQDVERGGKIIMPSSALEQLTRLNINYPMQFKIVNKNTNRTSHCGVLEFVADEGKVYFPLWMMQNLVLSEGDFIQIESVSLPVGTFAKFQPLSPEFLDITNPKAVLENCLRTFSCLTSGDVIAVKYNQRVYELCVLETQPGNAISIIECDMNVEFAAPVGYKEVEESKPYEEGMTVDPTELMPEPSGFVAFGGQGNRLDGKRRKDSGSTESATSRASYVRGIPDYDYQIGTLRFLRRATKSETGSKDEESPFKAFSGEGFSLKQRN